MKTKQIALIAIATVFVVALITNPSLANHKEVVKTKLNEVFQKKMKGQDSKFGVAFGSLMASSIINALVDNKVNRSNYFVFSTTTIATEKNTKTIGFGLFGNVFLSSKIDEALNNDN